MKITTPLGVLSVLGVLGGLGMARPVPAPVAAAPALAVTQRDPELRPNATARRVVPTQAVPRTVLVAGRTYRGRASWYGPGFHGRRTASGRRFDAYGAMTAAHRSLPFGTTLRVCTARRCVVVTVTDRGPYIAGRIVDLSQLAAKRLGILHSGTARVTATVLRARPVAALERQQVVLRRTPVFRVAAPGARVTTLAPSRPVLPVPNGSALSGLAAAAALGGLFLAVPALARRRWGRVALA